jgi:hypothetical protein
MKQDSGSLRTDYVTRSTRIGARVWAVCAGLAVFGCPYSPPLAMPGGQIAPPPGMEPTSPPGPQNVSRNGTYAGTAEPLDTGGGLCTSTQTVGGFVVHGSSLARYGQFRGSIAPDGGLLMVAGQNWIVGHFEGAAFIGQLDLLGRFGAGCTYMLNLDRTGP